MFFKRTLSCFLILLTLLGAACPGLASAAVPKEPAKAAADSAEAEAGEEPVEAARESGFYFVGVRLHTVDENGEEVDDGQQELPGIDGTADQE